MSAQSTHRNAFLAAIPASEHDLFHGHLHERDLKNRERLQEVGEEVRQVVFPYSGLVVLTMPLRDGAGGGAVLVARGSLVGAFSAEAAVPAMCDAVVYVAGRAARMSASAFRHALDHSPGIRRLTARYNAALMLQAHQTAACNASHPLEARISRCLLEVLDRIGGFDVPLTQIALSQMLGVQRTSFNVAVRPLEASGVIKCRRGCIHIVRREQLEGHACECYQSIKDYVSHLLALPAAPVADSVEPLARKAM